jgi:hypothetical protein
MNKPSITTPKQHLRRRDFIKYGSLIVGASVFSESHLLLAKGNAIQGKAVSGNQGSTIPLRGAVISLYQASSGVPQLLGKATTNATGSFSILTTGIAGNTGGVFYATAEVSRGVQLVSVIGSALIDFVTINELTTVAAGYAMAQFTKGGVLFGDEFGLELAAGMNENLVMPGTGESSPVLLSSPNGDQTNSLRSTRTLANLLAFYVRNRGQGVDDLFALATPAGGVAPENFLQALSNICRNPGQNVNSLYSLANMVDVYGPALTQAPDAWTIVVKVNDSGSDEHLIGGPGNIAFDSRGYAWVTNNVVQTTPYSSQFNFVLKPNGQPSDGKQGTPKSPLLGGGILGAGFGVAVAPDQTAWMGNFGWGGKDYNPSPDGNGSISAFGRAGQALSGKNGIQAGTERAQGIAADAQGNIWICSFGNSCIVVFLNGDPNRAVIHPEPDGSSPFDIQIASDGTAWVTNSGGLGPISNSNVSRYRLVGDRLELVFSKDFGLALKGLSLDSHDFAWIASGGDSGVYYVNGQGEVVGFFQGGGIDAPWSTAVDGDDNVWVANFGPEAFGSDFTTGCVTKLAGSNPATRPPGLTTGAPISPDVGYTLPSAGAEVLLHNGQQLYGPLGPASYNPLMRVTGVAIDQAGNVWACNNWKPNFDIDFAPNVGNPGGDGICIFVGLAKPRKS